MLMSQLIASIPSKVDAIECLLDILRFYYILKFHRIITFSKTINSPKNLLFLDN